MTWNIKILQTVSTDCNVDLQNRIEFDCESSWVINVLKYQIVTLIWKVVQTLIVKAGNTNEQSMNMKQLVYVSLTALQGER